VSFSPWVCVLFGWPLSIAAWIIPFALVSDIFDGIIARRLKVATPLLRRADGWADHLFLISFVIFVLVFRYSLLAPYMGWIIATAIFKIINAVAAHIRYGREAALHLYTAKLWAIPFYGVLFELIIGHEPLWLIWPTLIIGFIAMTEGLLATLLIPVWMHDKATIFAALKAYRNLPENAQSK